MKTERVASKDAIKLLESIKKLQDKALKVGWLEKSQYENGDSVAPVAVQNEFGNPRKNIPARPFMRPAIQDNKKNWEKTTEDGARKVLKGQFSISGVMDLLGFQVGADIKEGIKKVYYPALAERTVLDRIQRNARLSRTSGKLTERAIGNITKPLIDTGIMFNTVTHEIVDA